MPPQLSADRRDAVVVVVCGMALAGFAGYALARGLRAKPLDKRVAAALSTARELPKTPEKVKLALCQMLTGKDKQENIEAAGRCVQEAARGGAQLVVLPEMWNCPYENAAFPVYAEDLEAGPSPSSQALAEAARRNGVTLVGGSIPERVGERVYNTCLVYGTDGALLAKHRKVHLFDIDIPGGITFKESDSLSAGEALTVVDTPAGRLGLGICYDIRFPEMAMCYQQRGCQLLVYPGAFNMTTGPRHWELLAKARAVDNQVFVALCSPARCPQASYQAWGHSTIVGPFAQVLSAANEAAGIIYAELDYREIAERRQNMPLAQQRRGDLYALVDKQG